MTLNRLLRIFLLLAAFEVLLISCASSTGGSGSVQPTPVEETFLEKARRYTVAKENEERLSWQNYLYALDAIEGCDPLLARHYLDRSLNMLVAEKHDAFVRDVQNVLSMQETKKHDIEKDSVYRSEMLSKIMEALDEVYPHLSSGKDASSYLHYDFSLEGLEGLDEPPLDSTERIEIENFLDTLDLSRFSLPIELNERVMLEIHYLSKSVRSFTEASLSRKTAYDSMVVEKLTQHQMPLDLAYLPLVESGYKLKAFSRAKASGLWQFIPSTGKRFGLNSDYWVDMRRDPELATDAAIAYLTYLYKEFDDWLLTMAAYNCGEGRVRRLLREARADSTIQQPITYWDLKLPKETMHYVPRILAAMIIGHFPEHYGMNVQKESRMPFDTVTVFDCVPLQEIAPSLGITTEELHELNIELLKQTTPPTHESYTLRIPEGKRELFLEAYEQMDKSKWVRFQYHRVKKGETLSAIGRQYGLSVAQIQSANAMKNTKLQVGQSLLIPLPSKIKVSSKKSSADLEQILKQGAYQVKKGDNLASVARRFGVSVAHICEWNNVEKDTPIYEGQTLLLKKPKETQKEYRVQAGDTYQSIADSFNVSLEDFMKLNNASRERLFVGQLLKIPPSQKIKPEQTVSILIKKDSTHHVQSGETLSGIAKQYGITVSDLQKWNNLGSSTQIRAGQTLYIHLSSPTNVPGQIIYHTVQTGESLWDIARSYGITIQQIVEWNKLEDTKIKTGFRLEIRRNK